ncbi:OLC1v1029311C1 [Oldenlandia corymbosa var. corymbosa]|uniref:OLC1v1029311C1 n=1 Tax=Oldenlandia corymbosa var. corymbosa TaxID=529605 RepID=A0AAV1CFN1_OLDCO|nr:OLC1v1029311C1 [Oldenlandia corymbosa var. corymbosa]
MWRGVDFNPPDEYEHEAPGYADGSKMLTVKLRDSGGFILQRDYKYVEGEAEYFDDVNYELLTVEALYKLIDKTGYCRPHKLFYLVPDDVGTPKFTRIEDDEDIGRLIEMKTPHRLVEVFRIASIEFDPFMKSVRVDNEVDSNEDEDSEDEDYIDSEFEMSEDDEDFKKYVDERLESTTWCSYRSESEFVRHEDVGVGTGSGENESDDDCGSCDNLHSIAGSDEDDDTLRQHGIKDRRKINFQKNDKKFVRGYCENCNWEVYGVKVDDEKDPTFQIRTVNTKHTCGRVNSSRNVNSDIVSDWYVADFADDPKISVSHLQFRVLNEHRLTISRTQAWNAKKKALEKLQEIRDAEANMTAGRPHDEIPPLCECCHQYGHTADTCEVMDFCNWMQDNNMNTEGGGAGQTIGPENSEPTNDTTADDVILLDEVINTPNAPDESQFEDDFLQNFVKCDYYPQYGHTKVDCPEFESDCRKKSKSAAVEGLGGLVCTNLNGDFHAAIHGIINKLKRPQAVKSSERSASVTKLGRMEHATGAGDLGHHQMGQTAAVTAQVIVSSEEPSVSHAMKKKKKANKNVCAPIKRRCIARLKAAYAFKKKNDGLGETAAEPVVLDYECPEQTKKPKSTKV